eukprot:jgi/Tetstr1/459659/TSEL_005015.t1
MDSSTVLLAVVVIFLAAAAGKALALLLDWARVARALDATSMPRAPGALPLLGHALRLLAGTPWDIFVSWLVASGDSCVRFRVLNKECVLVRGPAALKRVFQTKQRQYGKDTGFTYHPFMSILGSGLVTSDGPLWQQQRLLIGPALRIDILDKVIGVAKGAVDRLSAKLTRARGSGKPVNMEEEFRCLTLQVIGKAILNLEPEECDAVFPQLYLPVMEESHRRVLQPFREYLPILPEWWLYRYRMHKLDSFIIGLLRARHAARASARPAKGDEADILDRIMSAVEDAGTPWGAGLEAQLCYEIKTFLLAGHETTASTLCWSLYELTQHKDMMAHVEEEAVAAFGPHDREPGRPAVEGMCYTLAVLKESLRKYSVVPVVVRVALKDDDDLCGYAVPRGARIMCSISGTHQMYEQPEKYRPDRFMPGGEYDRFDDAERPYMFVPFIQGPRNCLGQHFALLEARVVLALLVKRFHFRPVSKTAGDTHPWIIPVGPADGMWMLVD